MKELLDIQHCLYCMHLAGFVEYTGCISADRQDPPLTNETYGYDIKQSDGEASVMLELWEMQSAPSLPLFPGSLCSDMEVPDRVLSMGRIEQTVCK